MNERQKYLIELLRNYWSKNPKREFGAVIDDLLATNGSIKNLYYHSTDEFIQWIEEGIKHKKEYTSSCLQDLRVKRLKEYYAKPDRFIQEPKSLFINGEFSKSNYFGGDDIIRYFFNEVYEQNHVSIDFQYEMLGETFQMTIDAHHQHYHLDEHYIFTIVVSGFNIINLENFNEIYTFKVEDNGSDRISLALIGSSEITEFDYLFLINLIKASGFDFKLGTYPLEEI